jgi:K+-sensing histidine kinase KdpD
MAEDDRRPYPDELLAATQAQEAEARRGKLRIFFGTSPGVGKTYDMLLDHARRNNLGRIVVGCSTRMRARWLGQQAFCQRLGAKAPDIDLVTVARKGPGERRPSRGGHTPRGVG